MEIESVIRAVEGYGYLGIFLSLCFGLIGLPVPNEIFVMAVGFAASSDFLYTFPAFLVTLGGILFALTLSYAAGKYIGLPILTYLEQKEAFRKPLAKATSMISRYQERALFISYFFPVIRYLVPFLAGMGRMGFSRFAIRAYSSAIVWVLLFFNFGFWAGLSHKQLPGNVTVVLFLATGGLLLVTLFLKLRTGLKQKNKARHP
ncbi:DedA family protein [Pseudalkalibacillus caeni]|uniref:DedA family protein n=1 Tax=Exobacillus caeni TaxID=2574798 RepID=A0A5R9FAD4_9BACL|nr:DedA family protein [Pseudalkalibacillus caeni]TLS36595.1 DedA family protein [Pseudalkalibacillus caeni]